jgi:FkbM family methyltransferase
LNAPLKSLVKAVTHGLGYEIVRRSNDQDAFEQQRRLLARVPHPIIFDVGAHIGETSRAYARLFPAAQIYAFEPFPDSYGKLVSNTKGLPQITTFALALAEEAGEAELYVNASSATNSLFETDPHGAMVWGNGPLETRQRIQCRATTIDKIVSETGLDGIHLLKIDAQGAEYKILQGAAGVLRAGLIDLLYMEIITMPTYRGQRSLAYYLEFLDKNQMTLFGIYNLSFIGGQIRQLDAIFVRSGTT